jgi:hypothetical protein
MVVAGLTKGIRFPWMNDDRGSPWRACSVTPDDGRVIDAADLTVARLRAEAEAAPLGKRRSAPHGNGTRS